MTFHSYIAKPGFNRQAIDRDLWPQVARELASTYAQAEVKTLKRRDDSISAVLHMGDTNLSMTVYGQLVIQNPNASMANILFSAAKKLDAQVFSERGNAYADINDWQRRTQRQRQAIADTQRKQQKKKKLVFWLASAGISTLAGLTLLKLS